MGIGVGFWVASNQPLKGKMIQEVTRAIMSLAVLVLVGMFTILLDWLWLLSGVIFIIVVLLIIVLIFNFALNT
jgi:hypothetical protein